MCADVDQMWQEVSKRWDDRRLLDVANSWNSFQMISSLFQYNKWLPEGVRMGHAPYARFIYLGFDGETDEKAYCWLSVLIDAV